MVKGNQQGVERQDRLNREVERRSLELGEVHIVFMISGFCLWYDQLQYTTKQLYEQNLWYPRAC